MHVIHLRNGIPFNSSSYLLQANLWGLISLSNANDIDTEKKKNFIYIYHFSILNELTVRASASS